MKYFRLDWDTDYGIDHRRGWSVHIDGIVVVQFQRTLIGALWSAWRKWRLYQRDFREWQETISAAIREK